MKNLLSFYISNHDVIVHHLSSCNYIEVRTKEIEELSKNEFLKKYFLKATKNLNLEFPDYRENGVYFFGSAKAELKAVKDKTCETQSLKIECCDFNNLLDMVKLQKRIWEGKISPKISYDKKRSLWRRLIAG